MLGPDETGEVTAFQTISLYSPFYSAGPISVDHICKTMNRFNEFMLRGLRKRWPETPSNTPRQMNIGTFAALPRVLENRPVWVLADALDDYETKGHAIGGIEKFKPLL